MFFFFLLGAESLIISFKFSPLDLALKTEKARTSTRFEALSWVLHPKGISQSFQSWSIFSIQGYRYS